MWTGIKPYLVRDLWEYGASEDPSGGASPQLFERIENHYPEARNLLNWPRSLTSLMTAEANAAAFMRDINVKRCYRIALVAMPETWYAKLRRDIGGSMPTFTATPVESNGTKPQPIDKGETSPIDAILDNPNIVLPIARDLPDVESDSFEVESGPSLDVQIAGQVAMELLTRVVEIISAGSSSGLSEAKLRQLTADYESVTGRLAQRLEENERMRRQLRDTGDELRAVKIERDSLRARLRQTEANLNSALKGESAHAVTTEVMKRVDRIMRETPKPNPREGEE